MMVKYKKFDSLKESSSRAFHLLRSKMLGYPIDEDELVEIYRTDYSTPFLKEFNKVITNTSDPVIIQRYLNEVYYNGVVRECIVFNNLGRSYEEYRNYKDRMDLVKDSYFTKIMGYSDSFSIMASQIRAKALELKIIDLKPISSISWKDFNISGRYIPLYDIQEDLSLSVRHPGLKPIEPAPKDPLPTKPIPEDETLKNLQEVKKSFSEDDFIDAFFKEEFKKAAKDKILPYLKENYKNAKGKELAMFWNALLKLGYVEKIRHGDKKKIFNGLDLFVEGEHGAPTFFSNELNNQDHKHIDELKEKVFLLKGIFRLP